MKRLIVGFFGCLVVYVLMSFGGCGNRPMVGSVAKADADTRTPSQMRFSLEKVAENDFSSVTVWYLEDRQEGKGLLVIHAFDAPNITVETTATRHMIERP